ncbi:hypothetical protein ACQJBY_029400 [Aegilops geniculata]
MEALHRASTRVRSPRNHTNTSSNFLRCRRHSSSRRQRPPPPSPRRAMEPPSQAEPPEFELEYSPAPLKLRQSPADAREHHRRLPGKKRNRRLKASLLDAFPRSKDHRSQLSDKPQSRRRRLNASEPIDQNVPHICC